MTRLASSTSFITKLGTNPLYIYTHKSTCNCP
uniref:Uncharacterized protein n=1 Tax=Arundo donax TaxID=35708 RepID=A0A0A9B1S7_ARUDO